MLPPVFFFVILWRLYIAKPLSKRRAKRLDAAETGKKNRKASPSKRRTKRLSATGKAQERWWNDEEAKIIKSETNRTAREMKKKREEYKKELRYWSRVESQFYGDYEYNTSDEYDTSDQYDTSDEYDTSDQYDTSDEYDGDNWNSEDDWIDHCPSRQRGPCAKYRKYLVQSGSNEAVLKRKARQGWTTSRKKANAAREKDLRKSRDNKRYM